MAPLSFAFQAQHSPSNLRDRPSCRPDGGLSDLPTPIELDELLAEIREHERAWPYPAPVSFQVVVAAGTLMIAGATVGLGLSLWRILQWLA